jgi:hypothetical protein
MIFTVFLFVFNQPQKGLMTRLVQSVLKTLMFKKSINEYFCTVRQQNIIAKQMEMTLNLIFISRQVNFQMLSLPIFSLIIIFW